MPEFKRNIFENPCAEKWESMTELGENRTCTTCNETIYDLENFDLKTIANDYLNSGKCVRMNSSQVTFFQHLKNVQSVTGLSLLLLLSQPENLHAQFTSTSVETTIISGKINNLNSENTVIFVFAGKQRYSVNANKNGEFKLAVPRNVEIEKSNIRQLEGRSIRRKKINLHKVTLKMSHCIGTPSF